MKLGYFLESTTGTCCPAEVLQKGYRVRWDNNGTLMYGRAVSVKGDSVTVTDEKFNTDEKHEVARDKVIEVLKDPQGSSKGRVHIMQVVWKRSSSKPSGPLKIKRVDPVQEAAHHFPKADTIVLDPDRVDVYDIASALLPTLVKIAYTHLLDDKVKYERSHTDPDDEPFKLSESALIERVEDLLKSLSNRLQSERGISDAIQRVKSELKGFEGL